MNGVLPEDRLRLWAKRQVAGSPLRKLVLLLIIDEFGPGKIHQLATLASAAEMSAADAVDALTALQVAGLVQFTALPGGATVRIDAILAG